MSTTGFVAIEAGEGEPGCELEHGLEGETFLYTVFVYPQGLEAFIGVVVTPGYALLDTGAQHGVIGKPEYEALCERLAVQRLKPRHLPTFEAVATGVGGSVTFLYTVEVPIALQGVCGLLTVNVVKNSLPFLLPMPFCKKLGMILNTTDNTATWTKIGKVSEIVELPSEHIAVDILEFPPGGWKNPHQCHNTLYNREPDRSVLRSAFEIQDASAGSQLKLGCDSPTLTHTLSNVGQPSMSHSQPDLGTQYREVECRGRNGTIIRVREVVPLEEHYAQSTSCLPDLGTADQGQDVVGGGCLQAHLPTGTKHSECQREQHHTNDLPSGRQGLHGQGDPAWERRERPGQGHDGSSDVQPPSRKFDVPRQSAHKMVHLQAMPSEVGADPIGTDAPNGSSGGRPGHGDLWQACGQDLRCRLGGGQQLLPVDSHDGGERKLLSTASSVRTVHCDQGARGGFPGGAYANGPVNRILHGTSLAALAFSLTIGYVAHVVTTGSTYKDLEGPVFGTRVGIYHTEDLHKPWYQVQQDGPIDANIIPNSKYRLILYQLPAGAVEHSETDDNEGIPTVPRPIKNGIGRVLQLPASANFPQRISDLPAIPEEPSTPSALDCQREGAESSMGVDGNQMPGERVAIDPDAEQVSEDDMDIPPVPDFQPSAQQLKDLRLAHDNNGHPTNTDFARMIKLGNGKPELVKWVKHHFRCDDCEANRRPRAKRPSAVPKTYRFNHVVGLDLADKKNLEGERQHWLNVVCWGTSFQQVKLLPNANEKTAENVWLTFVDTWIRIFGCPDVIVLDPGLEFEGHFAEMSHAHGIVILPTDARSPWQNGRTERAGGLWKHQFNIAIRKCTPVNQSEFEALGMMCCAARNRYCNRSGFSPAQRVFGFTPRLPNSLHSDDAIDPGLLSENPLQDFQRSEELRAAATRAWASLDNRSRLLKSFRARHRTPHHFTEGQLVFVWRQPAVGPGHWKGPGIVIMATSGGCWVNMRGALWRCSNEQMRPATHDESLGAELVNRYLDDLRWDVQRNKGPKKYVDIIREGPPRFPGDAPLEDEEVPPLSDEEQDQDAREEIQEPESAPGTPPPSVDIPMASQSAASEQPMSEPHVPSVDSGIPTALGCQRVGDQVSSRERSRSPPRTPERADPPQPPIPPRAPPPFPFPFDQRPNTHYNYYVENELADSPTFFVTEAVAEYDTVHHYFVLKKAPVDAEINVNALPPAAQQLFWGPDGSRAVEWTNMVN